MGRVGGKDHVRLRPGSARLLNGNLASSRRQHRRDAFSSWGSAEATAPRGIWSIT
jgi:hypothetical protein